MSDPITKREIREELQDYVRKQQLEDALNRLPYPREKAIREIVQNAIRVQWVQDQYSTAKQRLISGGFGLIGGLIGSGLLDFIG